MQNQCNSNNVRSTEHGNAVVKKSYGTFFTHLSESGIESLPQKLCAFSRNIEHVRSKRLLFLPAEFCILEAHADQSLHLPSRWGVLIFTPKTMKKQLIQADVNEYLYYVIKTYYLYPELLLHRLCLQASCQL